VVAAVVRLKLIVDFLSVVTRAILFGSNMHQIVQRLGLCHRPNCGSSQRSPSAHSWLKGMGKGEEGEGREEERGE